MEQVEQQFAALKIGPKRPQVKPPKRKIEELRTSIDGFPALCTNCKKKPGKFICSRCQAVKFCSKDCQKALWPSHKLHCNKVRQAKDTVTGIIKDVKEMHGKETLIASAESGGNLKWTNIHDTNPTPSFSDIFQVYVRVRQDLIMMYGMMGMVHQSPLAYRLAAENALDLLCMTYKKAEGEDDFQMIGGLMVAAGMDQEAFNFFVYFRKRRLMKREALPYLDICGNNADIQDPITMKLLLDKKDPHTFLWSHHYVILSLLKYKKLQHNLMERRKSVVKWMSFLMGTHPDVGSNSTVQLLRGNRKVLKKIQNMVVNKRLVRGLKKEPIIINKYLKEVQERNRLIIRGLLDPDSCEKEEMHRYCRDMHCLHEDCSAIRDINVYVRAWKMSPAYQTILTNFLETGKISQKPWHEPAEGFFQASIDTDPTKAYGDCSEFSLVCHRTKTGAHRC